MEFSNDGRVAEFQVRIDLTVVRLEWCFRAPLLLAGIAFLIGSLTLRPELLTEWLGVGVITFGIWYVANCFYGLESNEILDELATVATDWPDARIALLERLRDPRFREDLGPWAKRLEERLPFRLEG